VEPQTTSTGHVFISYSRKDKRYVRKLDYGLRKRGFQTWIDDELIDFGAEWWETTEQAIRDCAALIVVMTPRSKQSDWVKKEIHLALDEGKPIFPLLLHGQKFPILGDLHYTDVSGILSKLPDDDFYERLEQAITVQSEEDGEVEEPESGEKEPPAPEKPTPEVWSWLRHLPPLAQVILLLLGVALIVGVIFGLLSFKPPSDSLTPSTTLENPPILEAIAQATATSQPLSPTPSAAPETASEPPTPNATPTTTLTSVSLRPTITSQPTSLIMPTATAEQVLDVSTPNATPTTTLAPDPLRPNIELGPDPSNPFTHANEPERVFTFHWDGGCIVAEDIPPNLTEMDIELKRGQGDELDMWLGTTDIDAIKDGLGCDTAANWNTFKLENLQAAPAISGEIRGPDGEVEKTLGMYPPEQSLYWRLKICDEGGTCWSWPD
jgi:hypothetical protein